MNRTLTLRVLFVATLFTVGALFGGIAYSVTKHLEEAVAVQTYESLALGALDQAHVIATEMLNGATTLSSLLGFSFPDAQQWPLAVGQRGFAQLASQVGNLSQSVGHSFMTIVRPEEVEAFEAHAQSLYQRLKFPPEAGNSNFGFGIYGVDPEHSDYPDQRFHDVSGNTTWGSPYKVLVPIFQHTKVFTEPGLLLRNMHQGELRGRALDSIMECADRHAHDEERETSPACSVVTDFTEILMRSGPAAVLQFPIFPADNRTTLVGFIGTSIFWEEVLTDVFPDFIHGLDCVLTSGTGASYTYTIQDGVPVLVGPGDLHDPDYQHHGRSVTLFDDKDTDATASISYTLTIYPSQELFDEFYTNIPIFVSVGFVMAILLCIAVFFVYDHFMQYESNQRKKVLDLKRRFVRFVSHEIRTPLNVVCMGLELLQAELNASISAEQQQDGNTYNYGGAEEKEEKHPLVINDNTKDSEIIPYCLDLTMDILENTNTAVAVLNDLLNYDKIESGTFKLEMGKVDIWQLVRKTTSEFSIQARNRNISLHVSVADEEDQRERDKFHVQGDDIRLAQVIRNLVSNALKFTPEKGSITVTAECLSQDNQAKNDANTRATKAISRAMDLSASINAGPQKADSVGVVRITVKDNGAGLSKDQLSQLFGEYVQFDANKLQSGGGSGLGLCITKEIVEHHGGTITAQSRGRGSGTSFVVELPLQENGTSQDSSLALEGDAVAETILHGSLSHRRRHHHILVVDDVILNTKMLVRLLQRAGHTCAVATNGQEAIEAFQANRADMDFDRSTKSVSDSNGNDECPAVFDTILMDYEMPLLNGPDATKQLRAMGCQARIIGITGNVLAEDVSFFKTSGADHVLPKPVSLAAVEALWQSRRAPGK